MQWYSVDLPDRSETNARWMVRYCRLADISACHDKAAGKQSMLQGQDLGPVYQ